MNPANPQFVVVPWTPTEAQWGGLARQIMMWLDWGPPHTPRSLLKHLERCGEEIPAWLREEPEMKALDHSMSKGTRVVLIYRAMLAAAPSPDETVAERVARAICVADGDEPDRDFISGNVTMPCWRSYISRAYAALAAINAGDGEGR